MGRHLGCALAVAIGLQLAGCITDYGPVVVLEPEEVAARSYAAPRLQRGDRIKVTVYGEDNLGGVYDIDPGGYVSLPLAGTIRAAGHTRAELEAALTAKFKSEYLQNPKVTVDYAAFRPIYVFGEAEHPGEFPYRASASVLDAITMAGGLTYRGSRWSVLVKHSSEPEWREVPLSEAMNISVLPGDSIRIPERYF